MLLGDAKQRIKIVCSMKIKFIETIKEKEINIDILALANEKGDINFLNYIEYKNKTKVI